MITKKTLTVLFSIIFSLVKINLASVGYVITTPRRWTSGSDSDVCMSFQDAGASKGAIHNISVSIKNRDIEPVDIMPPQTLSFSQDQGVHCEKFLLPVTKETRAHLFIDGVIGEEKVNYSKPINIATNVKQTFVQTDKYLYKPSQTVKFRILSVTGPKLEVSTNQYDDIVVENPSGSRIAQWLNVPNEQGMIHKEFQLSEEPEEGTYRIKARLQNEAATTTTFKVEEYVLPKYKVTVKPPKYILGTTKVMTYKVCAKYTFGQPVKGVATLQVDNGGWGNYKIIIEKQDKISGCQSFNVTAEELKLNGDQYYSYQVSASAIVVEDGTNVELTASKVSTDISRTAIDFNDVGKQQFYKPEVLFVGEIAATYPDDSPVLNELMEVCILKSCKNITTNNKGILKFGVPPHLQDENIQIKAVNYPFLRANDSSWRSVMYASSYTKNLKKYHSPSNSSLVIELKDDKVECHPNAELPRENIMLSFPVTFSAAAIESALVTVQVISRGQIMYASNEKKNFNPGTETFVNPDLLIEPLKEPVTKNLVRGSFTVKVELPIYASPTAKVVVFYARPDGEVVSDMRTIDITECLMNVVNMTWSTKKAQPGEQATLSISAEPQSLCSIGVVDKSVQLLAAKKTSLTIKKLLDVAEKASVPEYENSQVDDYEYCRNKNKTKIDPPILEPVPLPLVREKRSSPPYFRPWYSDDIDALKMFDTAGLYVFSNLNIENRPCRQRYDGGYIGDRIFFAQASPGVGAGFGGGAVDDSPPAEAFSTATKDTKKNLGSKTRTYLPETWLWTLDIVQDTGVNEELLTLPDTITEWIGSAVCVHPTKGVGISEPVGITTFRDFFVQLTLPASVKRGETFPVKVSIFNYLKESLPITMDLEESIEFDILAKEGIQRGSGTRSICLAPEDKTVFSIRIRPKVVGDVNITVSAIVDANTVSDCGQSTGKVRSDTLIKPIRVELEGFRKDKVFTEYVCPEGGLESTTKWTLTPPANIVPDSARGFVSVVGNLMGPTIENLGKLVRMPYGCGEQNMLNFAPNIFVMPYLSGNDTKEIAENAIKFMQKGYQRELNYRHEDGSYSAFGKSDDSGSTWLTAFVLKSFSNAMQYINIDITEINLSSDWLRKRQLENGCFESVGKVLHKGMKGGISKTKSPSLLSSFVLIALLESGEDVGSKAVREGLFCLDADVEEANAYALAVKAYALALAKSPGTPVVLRKLLDSAKSQLNIYWDLPENLGSSVELETASYAVLALLTYDPIEYFGDATSIIQAMNGKRNGQGGFISTQDTIVALQAIAKFDELTNKGPQDLIVLVDISSVPPKELYEQSFTVNDNNALLQQKMDLLESFPQEVTVLVEGSGCALIQAVLRYNEPDPEPSKALSINVTTATEPDKNCNTKRITACVAYLLDDKESNMGIIEVNLVSGYIPVKKDLKKVVGYGTGLFKRYEVDGTTVTFYVDQFSAKELCASFRIKQEVEVEDPKPGSVKVYDYYKPEYYVTEKYTLPPKSECKTMNEIDLTFLSEIVEMTTENVESTTLMNEEFAVFEGDEEFQVFEGQAP